jgi:hypothetical protein
MDASDDWFLDDEDEGAKEELPTDEGELAGLVQALTMRILQFDWDASVFGQYFSRGYSDAIQRRARICRTLGEKADDAIEAGRQQFAADFDEESRRLYLSDDALDGEILESSAKLAYLEWLKSEERNM